MQQDYEFDLFVIGAGSGGVRAARMAAQRNARVGLAEVGALGGTCVNVGCIPKKLYSYAAHYGDAFKESHGFGWDAAPPLLDWQRLKSRRAAEILRLNGIYQGLLEGAGVRIVRGRASLYDDHTVQVETEQGGRMFTARHILIATGGTPSVPTLPGSEHAVTSDAMFDLDRFPQRLVVVGGGYIACEFASIFNGMGAQVTQLCRGTQLLRGFDDDIREFIADEMGKSGVDVRLGVHVASIAKSAGDFEVELADGSDLSADTVLYATGRVPNVSGLGLEAVGIVLRDNGAIVVDADYRTSVPSVYALGDVTGRVQLTPVALGEAMAFADQLFGQGRRKMNYDHIPTVVFTHPNIGTVGYGEAQAREMFGEVTVYRSEFRPLKHTLSGRPERAMVKLVVDASDRVVGLHMVGPDAGEIVQGFAVAMKAGATKSVFDSTVGVHPTLAEEFVTMREAVTTP
ncbi:glutathione-disulfide reductase [Bordetella petrii]|uniref:Probable glutathione reductase n=1 Tax=Bordetella petrii (strain ATCC BAA-461 / DSM 12804 / CCUG 43448 / CIP 107267 / Se-1111R) TaxID=340100 RepID=A9I2J4_BORPD|nr:glutathione-disulfide reductase [Bordetella petrii]CAP44067.1 probable glutathione reductase [Bordetella petrii]